MIILSLIVLVLDLIALGDILFSWKSVQKKFIWIIVILVLPVLGMLLYFLIEKKRK